MKASAENQAIEQDNNKNRKPIRFLQGPTVLNHFANYTLAQYDLESDTFSLSFYEIQKPPIMGTKEQIKQQMEQLDSIPAFCVSRIIVTPAHFRQIIAAMQDNLHRYENALKEEGSSQTE